jgi:hypothetical protein
MNEQVVGQLVSFALQAASTALPKILTMLLDHGETAAVKQILAQAPALAAVDARAAAILAGLRAEAEERLKNGAAL